jgi:hypothetical protein
MCVPFVAMTLDTTQGEDRQVAARTGLVGILAMVPRSGGRWDLRCFASAFRGTDASMLEPRVRAPLLLRVAAVDRAPYRREELEAGARELRIHEDEVRRHAETMFREENH